MQLDPLVQRIADLQGRAKERAARLLASLPRVVGELRRRGATRVVLFGSLATGADPHAETDVDLLVEGLGLDDCAEALLDLEVLLEAPVDLVPAVSASERLLRRVRAEGRDITQITATGEGG